MKRTLLSILCSIPLWAVSQSLRIEQLFDSLEHSPRYQQDLLQTQIRRAELSELRSDRIPVFYADANLQRNLIIPTTPVPAIAFDPNAQEGAIIPLKFATRWSSKAGIQLEWSLFDPKRRLDEKERQLAVRQAEIQAAQTAQDWRRDATLAYASVVLATHQYELARQDSMTYAQILKVNSARYQAGREPATTHRTAQQEFERKQIQLHQAWAVLLEADLELRKYVDLSGTTSLATDIEGICDHVQTLQNEKHTLQSLSIDQQIAALQQQGLRRQLLPSVTLNAYLGEQYYDNQFRLTHGDAWFGNSFVNLAFRIPISAYLTAKPTLRKAALQYALTTKQLEEERNHDRINDQQKRVRVRAAQQKVDALKRIAFLAQQTKTDQEAAYLAGRLLLSDYNQSVAAYHQAQQEVWQAEYDLIALLME